MPLQIVLTTNPLQDGELLAMGFERREVFIKRCPHGNQSAGQTVSAAGIEAGIRELLRMPQPPAQFVVADYWGRGVE